MTFDDLIHGPITFSSDVIGDFIIKRTDGGYSYNFAVVVDDAGMEITDVIRGEDHITNTARQMMLFSALGKPAPRYGHHSLILAPDGSKLSKRHGATSIGDFKGLGYLSGGHRQLPGPAQLAPGRRAREVHAGRAGGGVRLERVSKSPAIFDIQKLNWLNGLYIRELVAAGAVPADRALPGRRAASSWPRSSGRWWPRRCRPTWWCWATLPAIAAVFVDEADPATCQGAPTRCWRPGTRHAVRAGEGAFAAHAGRVPARPPRRGSCCAVWSRRPRSRGSRASRSTIRCAWR